MIKNKIKLSEAIAIILSIFFAHSIMSIPRTILTTTRSGTILNLIFITLIAFSIIFLIAKLMKDFNGKDILDISEYLGGKVFKNIIGGIFITYFLVTTGLLLRNFAECLKIVYFPMTDIFFIILTFVIVLMIAGKSNINSLSKIALLITPFVIMSVVFIFSSNLNNFTFSNTFPLIGDGYYNTFILGLSNLGSFGAISFLYFLPPYLKEPNDFKKVSVISFSIASIYLFFCVCTILFMFDFLLEANQLTALYSAARHIDFGTFFQRLESAFLLIWIIQMITYFTISLLFCLNIFKKLSRISTKKPLVYTFCLLVFSISLLPKNYAISYFFEKEIYSYIIVLLSLILVPCILILAKLKKERT